MTGEATPVSIGAATAEGVAVLTTLFLMLVSAKVMAEMFERLR